MGRTTNPIPGGAQRRHVKRVTIIAETATSSGPSKATNRPIKTGSVATPLLGTIVAPPGYIIAPVSPAIMSRPPKAMDDGLE
jgi:hypothetical protein